MRLILATIIAFILSITAAQAQGRNCGPREQLVSSLEGEKYSEHRRATGMTSNGWLMELFVNPKTGSWTVVGSEASGVSCILGAGGNWEEFDFKPIGLGA